MEYAIALGAIALIFLITRKRKEVTPGQFRCAVCGATFDTMEKLLLHQQAEHGYILTIPEPIPPEPKPIWEPEPPSWPTNGELEKAKRATEELCRYVNSYYLRATNELRHMYEFADKVQHCESTGTCSEREYRNYVGGRTQNGLNCVFAARKATWYARALFVPVFGIGPGISERAMHIPTYLSMCQNAVDKAYSAVNAGFTALDFLQQFLSPGVSLPDRARLEADKTKFDTAIGMSKFGGYF